MRVHLTEFTIKSLPHSDGQKTAWDTQTHGLGIRVGKHRKTWTVMLGASRRRFTLGHYPHMSLKDARAAAVKLKFTKDTDSPYFKDVLEDFVKLHLEANTKPSSAKVLERLLRYHFGHFGTKRLADISARDVTAYLNSIAGTPSEANQAHRAIKLFFNWSASQHLIEVSPLIHSKPPHKTVSRDRVLSDNELTTLLLYEKIPQFQTMLKLLALTAQRRSQIGGLTRQNIQPDTLHWSKDEMKGNRPHTIPITPVVRGLLEVPRTSQYLFAEERPFSSWSKHLAKLRKDTNLPHFTIHDIRRTTATNMRRIGIPSATVEAVLHHTKPKVAGIYDRYQPLKEMREALEQHENWLSALLEQKA